MDQFTQAAQAEIERREAYETRLVAALANCRRPLSPSLPAAGTTTESHHATTQHTCGSNGCGHASDCAVHNEPAMPAGPCDCSIEAEIKAKGLTAPRVTPADLQANILHTEIVKHVSPSGQVLRWAVLTTRNGFAVTGRPSASVSSANDNEEIGKKVAIDNAMQELWPLMGYELRSKLAGVNDSSKAEQVLDEVLSVVQHYLPPDGGTVHDAMDKIIGLVDPWPLHARPLPCGAKPRTAQSPST